MVAIVALAIAMFLTLLVNVVYFGHHQISVGLDDFGLLTIAVIWFPLVIQVWLLGRRQPPGAWPGLVATAVAAAVCCGMLAGAIASYRGAYVSRVGLAFDAPLIWPAAFISVIVICASRSTKQPAT